MQPYTNTQPPFPKIGLGTFRMTGNACSDAVQSALAMGYRHIDTAQMYGNEDAVGAGIAASSVARADLHVTTKVWWTNLEPDAMRQALADSLAALQLEYVDLYLVHWPAPDMDLGRVLDTMASFQKEGRARAIGVSNFTLPLLRRAVEEYGAVLSCNQIEYHALLDQTPIRDYARSKGIAVTAYAPLAQGRLADYPELAEIAHKHDAQPSQVALKWLLDQDGVAAIPKASRVESQRSNLDALSITLDEVDRAVIAGLPKNQRFVNPAFAPQWDAAS